MKSAFRALQSIPAGQIMIFSRFEGLGDTLRITKDLWAELVPELRSVQVELDKELAFSPQSFGSALRSIFQFIHWITV